MKGMNERICPICRKRQLFLTSPKGHTSSDKRNILGERSIGIEYWCRVCARWIILLGDEIGD